MPSFGLNRAVVAVSSCSRLDRSVRSLRRRFIWWVFSSFYSFPVKVRRLWPENKVTEFQSFLSGAGYLKILRS